MNLLEVKSLYAGFRIRDKLYPAARDISFTLEKGHALGLIGESGCGKTVTAYSIMRLLQSPGEIISGSVYFKDEDLLQCSEAEMRKKRGKEISMIFQEPSTALDPCYTAGYQISETILAHQNISKAEARNKAIALIDSMKIPDPEKIYSCYPHELSGGMQQRIMIASALASGSSLMIADEPTTALDVTVQSQILSILKSKVKDEGLSLIFISHDLGITANLCERTAVLYAGEIVEIGSSETIFRDPIHPYTQALIESIPSQNAKERHLRAIQGNVPSIDYETQGCRFYDRCRERSQECLEKKVRLEEKKKNHSARCIKK